MTLDIKKLRDQQKYINKRAKEEQLEEYIIASEEIGKFLEFEKGKKKIEQSPRVLNNWAQQGLINHPDEGKKRTYNRIEGIWIDLVSELREFGLGLEKIKTIRDFLFETKIKDSGFSPLKFSIIYSLLIEPYILLVFVDGEIKLMPKSKYVSYLGNEFILPMHISVNILNTSQTEFPKNNFTDFTNLSDITQLREKELELLYYLRTGDYDEIKVKMSDGEIYLIESAKKINPGTKVIDIINKSTYQDIEIKVRDGKTVLIKSTEIKRRLE